MLYRLGLLAFLASSLFAAPAAAFCRLTTESPSTAGGRSEECETDGIELAWQQRCISYTLVPSAEVSLEVEAVRGAIDRSFTTWMQVTCGIPARPLPLVLGQTDQLGECSDAEYNRFGPNANTIAFVSDWGSRGADYVDEAFGLTLVWHNPDTGEILDADIQVNLTKGEIAICGDECTGLYADLQNTLTHEAGHFLGLAHSDVLDAAMYGVAPIAQVSKRMLHDDDKAGACAIYGELSMPECEPRDYAPRRGFTPKCSAPVESNSCAVRPGVVRRGAAAAFAIALLGFVLAARRGALAGLAALAMLSVAGKASAFCRLTTAAPSPASSCATEGEGLAWDRSCISYTVVPPADERLDLDAVRDTVDEAFGAWAEVDCGSERLPLAFGQSEALGECTTAQYNVDAPNANMIFFLDEWQGSELPAEAFALTLVWHDPKSGRIFDADMQLNAELTPFAICGSSCPAGTSDLANVVTHEAGHFLGLGHSDVPGATMSSAALPGEIDKRSLELDDRSGICAIYGDRGTPSCQGDDYLPDRGFTPLCAQDLPSCDGGVAGDCAAGPDAGTGRDSGPGSGSSGSSCAVQSAGPSRGSLGLATGALIALVVVARRRSARF